MRSYWTPERPVDSGPVLGRTHPRLAPGGPGCRAEKWPSFTTRCHCASPGRPTAATSSLPTMCARWPVWTWSSASRRRSENDLLHYWKDFGLKAPSQPRLFPGLCPLSGRIRTIHPTRPRATSSTCRGLKLRKNHLLLLDACEKLWRSGEQFHLDLIGIEDALYRHAHDFAQGTGTRRPGPPRSLAQAHQRSRTGSA